jgi:EAL and modified HD-GYP domain-containing signal transduction protein
MFAFVARQPILDREKEVYAYELLFRDGKNNCFPDIAGIDDQRQSLIKDSSKLSLDDISCQKTSFISFQKDTIVNGLPASLDPKNVVVEVDRNEISSDGLIEACKNIKGMGFQIAMDDPDFQPNANEFLSLVDIVKVDVTNKKSGILKQNIEHLINANIKLVAEKVDRQSDFIAYKDLGFDYFQGYFFSKPEAFTQTQLPTSKLSLVELIGETSSETFDLERINQIIERDVGLSYMLLRFINNPMVNKRYKITSLRHAITYMGEVEVKKFIALLALANLSDNKPMELMHLSLVRAKFCDLIAQEKRVGDNPPTGFMVGLFSLLDALLDQKMQDLVAKMPIVDEVKFALCGGQNDFYLYLMLAKAFESATWMKVKRIADMLEIDQKRLHALFNQAILWGNGVRQSISPHFPKPIIKK